jgi:hypothetical protein
MGPKENIPLRFILLWSLKSTRQIWMICWHEYVGGREGLVGYLQEAVAVGALEVIDALSCRGREAKGQASLRWRGETSYGRGGENGGSTEAVMVW